MQLLLNYCCFFVMQQLLSFIFLLFHLFSCFQRCGLLLSSQQLLPELHQLRLLLLATVSNLALFTTVRQAETIPLLLFYLSRLFFKGFVSLEKTGLTAAIHCSSYRCFCCLYLISRNIQPELTSRDNSGLFGLFLSKNSIAS